MHAYGTFLSERAQRARATLARCATQRGVSKVVREALHTCVPCSARVDGTYLNAHGCSVLQQLYAQMLGCLRKTTTVSCKEPQQHRLIGTRVGTLSGEIANPTTRFW